MILANIKIHNVRTINSTQIDLHPRFNFIVGPNGSGKTSILEALYLLSCGHSFRSREIMPIVSHGQAKLTVFASTQDESSISIQKSSALPTQIKLNHQVCTSTSQLAHALPAQIFFSDLFQIIDASSSVRRSVLDWGLFHVKHGYHKSWKEYKKVLKQRNALLKTKASYDQFIPWDKQLDQLAQELDLLRREYFVLWQQIFQKILSQLTSTSCSIEYYKGWDKKNTGKPLFEVLTDNFASDQLKTFTQYGPHQADILIHNDNNKAKHTLSRGQQKIILIALKLAQAQMLEGDCLFLFDDYSSELDEDHQLKLMHYLMGHTGQYVITSTKDLASQSLIAEKSVFKTNEMFHVKQEA